MYLSVLLGMQENLPSTFKMHKQVGVVDAQIVEDDRRDRGLGVQPQIKVAGAIGCIPVLP